VGVAFLEEGGKISTPH